MSIERVLHQGAPTPRGPYSSAVRAGDFIFVSGLGPVDDNDQYAFGAIQPARTTIEARSFQAAMRVEIDCVAYQPHIRLS